MAEQSRKIFDGSVLANFLLPTEFDEAEPERVAKEDLASFTDTPNKIGLAISRLRLAYSLRPLSSGNVFDSNLETGLSRRVFSYVDYRKARNAVRKAQLNGLEAWREGRRLDAEADIAAREKAQERLDEVRVQIAIRSPQTVKELNEGLENAELALMLAIDEEDIASAEQIARQVGVFRGYLQAAENAPQGRSIHYWSRQLLKAQHEVSRAEYRRYNAEQRLERLGPRVDRAEARDQLLTAASALGAAGLGTAERAEAGLRLRAPKSEVPVPTVNGEAGTRSRSETRLRSRELERRRLEAVNRVSNLDPSEVLERVSHPATFSSIVDLAVAIELDRKELQIAGAYLAMNKAGATKQLAALSQHIGAKSEQLTELSIAIGQSVVNQKEGNVDVTHLADEIAKYDENDSIENRRVVLREIGQKFLASAVRAQLRHARQDKDVENTERLEYATSGLQVVGTDLLTSIERPSVEDVRKVEARPSREIIDRLDDPEFLMSVAEGLALQKTQRADLQKLASRGATLEEARVAVMVEKEIVKRSKGVDGFCYQVGIVVADIAPASEERKPFRTNLQRVNLSKTDEDRHAAITELGREYVAHRLQEHIKALYEQTQSTDATRPFADAIVGLRVTQETLTKAPVELQGGVFF